MPESSSNLAPRADSQAPLRSSFLQNEFMIPLIVAVLTVAILFLVWEIIIRSLQPGPDAVHDFHLARGISASLCTAMAVTFVLWRSSRRRAVEIERRAGALVESVVSRERQALNALQVSERRYRALYENTPMMYFTLDTEGTVLSVNEEGSKQLGYEHGELLGGQVLDVFHEDSREQVKRDLQTFLSDNKDVARWEARKRRKDGSVITVAETVSTIHDESGRTVILVICEDISERKRSEQRLREYQEALRALSSDLALAEEGERRRIAIGLHDQVGQTLALAKIQLHQLQHSGDDQRIPVIQRVEDLLEQTLISCRSLTFDLCSPILYELGLEAALKSLGPQLEAASDIHFQFAAENKPNTVPEELAIILYRSARELLRNAVKHSKAKNATMKLRGQGDHIKLEILDDGVGFDTMNAGLPSRDGGFGLFSVTEQLRSVGGSIKIESSREDRKSVV